MEAQGMKWPLDPHRPLAPPASALDSSGLLGLAWWSLCLHGGKAMGEAGTEAQGKRASELKTLPLHIGPRVCTQISL